MGQVNSTITMIRGYGECQNKKQSSEDAALFFTILYKHEIMF